MLAHRDLEGICLERDVQREKIRLEHRYAELVYDGLWFSPLKKALDAFVPGDAALRHRRGAPPPVARARARSQGRRSPHSLYDYALATYDAEDALPPRGLRRLRPALGPVRRDLGGHPGRVGRLADVHPLARPLRRGPRRRSCSRSP